jgi:putative endonuclease
VFPVSLLDRLLAFVRRGRAPRYRGSRGQGQDWEDAAARHLRRAGYEILERNYRTRVGEIDFVARDGETLCFIEVKGRRSARFGSPAEAVTLEKRRRIHRAAQAYLQRCRLSATRCRFDVVSIREGVEHEGVEILRNAFEGPLPPRRRR